MMAWCLLAVAEARRELRDEREAHQKILNWSVATYERLSANGWVIPTPPGYDEEDKSEHQEEDL